MTLKHDVPVNVFLLLNFEAASCGLAICVLPKSSAIATLLLRMRSCHLSDSIKHP
jgi:hypothetical protein